MDVPVSSAMQKQRRRRRWWFGGGVILVLALVTLGLSRLQPAFPLVEKSTIWTDTVKRGEMLRQIRGSGVLVPEEIRWIPTINAGHVERIFVLPGAIVKADTVLVELSNSELEQAAVEAESQLKAAQADLINLKVQLDSQKLTQQATVATAEANYITAKVDSDTDEALNKVGLLPPIIVKQATTKTDQLAKLFKIEEERLQIGDPAAKAQLAAEAEKIAQLKGVLDFKRRQIEGLKICAGMDGVLQRLGDSTNPLQVGQQLSPGVLVARVVNPAKLKAVIKIAETQARDVQWEQKAEIDTRNGVISGHVVRIDPAVENGTVAVDIALDGPLPKGARPDLSVDGVIQLERLENVLFVGRPVQGQPDSLVGIFKLVDEGRGAIMVPVRLGRSSVNTIEIVQGLEIGDQVILSDMSQWETHKRVRLR